MRTRNTFPRRCPRSPAADIASAHKDALLADLHKAGDEAAAAYQHLRKFVADTFFDNPDGTDASALKPDYRADRFAFGQTEYDWALHNNLRLDTTANDLYMQAAPIIVESREQIIALAREVAKEPQVEDAGRWLRGRARGVRATESRRAPQ